MNNKTEEVKSLYIKASEIEPKEVRWLWYPYIPYGKVSIREMVGHADERITYHNYCFDRSSDAERQQVMDRALSL